MFPEVTDHPRLAAEIGTGTKSQLLQAGEVETEVLYVESFQETYDVEKGKNKRGKTNTLADLDLQIQEHLDQQGQHLDQIGGAVFTKLEEALCSYIAVGLSTAGRTSEHELREFLRAFLPTAEDLPVLTAYIIGRKAYLAAKVAHLYRDGDAPTEMFLGNVLPNEISEEATQVFVNCAKVIRDQLIGHVEHTDREEADRARVEAEARKVREEAERKNKAVTEGLGTVAYSLVALNVSDRLSEQSLMEQRIKDAEIELELALEKRFNIHDLQSFTPAPLADRFGTYNQLAHKAGLLDRTNSGATTEQKDAAHILRKLELHRVAQDYLRQFLADLKRQVIAEREKGLPMSNDEVSTLFRALEESIDERLSVLAPTDWAKRVERATATIVAALPAPTPAPALVPDPAVAAPVAPRRLSPALLAPVAVEPDWDRLNVAITALTMELRNSQSPIDVPSIARQLLDMFRADLAQDSIESDEHYQSRIGNLVYPLSCAMAEQLRKFVAAPAAGALDASDIAQAVVQILVDDYGVEWKGISVQTPEVQKSRLRRFGEGALKLAAVAGFAVAFDKCDGTDRLVDGYHSMRTSHPSAQVETSGSTEALQVPESTASTVAWVKCDHLVALPSDPSGGMPKCGDADLAASTGASALLFAQCNGAQSGEGKLTPRTVHGFAFADTALIQPSIDGDVGYKPFQRSASQVCADEGTGIYAVPVVKQ
jgi:hypothetical protein